MTEKGFNLLDDTESILKIDKDLVEIQKTIINYGEKLIIESDKVQKLLRTLVQKDKGLEKSKEVLKTTETSIASKDIKDSHILRHLLKLEIPKGYKGNE